MQMQTQGSETSQYLEEKKANQGTFFLIEFRQQCRSHYGQEEGSCDALSSGERNGYSPNCTCLHVQGCRAAAEIYLEELQNVRIMELAGKRDPRR
jgi:hypothetical protein